MLNTVVAAHYLSVFSPTLNFEAGDVGKLPVNGSIRPELLKTRDLIELSTTDWNSFETSLDFSKFSLLLRSNRVASIEDAFQGLRGHWQLMTQQMQDLEEGNNRVFIEAYGLQDELAPEVSLNAITLACNPQYRYGGDKSEEELEALLLADTVRELVSYAVGCMLGRYSLDKPGLILANQGETLADYLEQHRLAQVPQPRFPADDDNVIPVLDGDWFADDITLRFRQFLRMAFGDEHYEDNLAFIERALNLKGKRNYRLRDYFLSEFYARPREALQEAPHLLVVQQPEGQLQRADLHAPLPPRHGERGTALPARLPQESG